MSCFGVIPPLAGGTARTEPSRRRVARGLGERDRDVGPDARVVLDERYVRAHGRAVGERVHAREHERRDPRAVDGGIGLGLGVGLRQQPRTSWSSMKLFASRIC